MSFVSRIKTAQRAITLPLHGSRAGLLMLPILVACTVGCSPWQLARRTLHRELNAYPRVTDGRLACAQYKRWAKKEWAKIVAETGETYSNDYASGFLQGFVDQVYAGGKVQPPPMPPRRYWRLQYRNKHGRRAIENYYNGFEHGAQVAYDNGYRERATIPSSLYMSDKSPDDSSAGEGTMTQESVDGAFEVPTPNELIPPQEPALEPSETPLDPPTESDESSPLDGQIPDPPPLPMPLEKTTAWPVPSTTSLSLSRRRSDESMPSEANGQSHDSADALPDETADELPPAPPWRRTQDNPSMVVPASHEVPRHVPDSGLSQPGDEFDPFAGTHFGQLTDAPDTSIEEPAASVEDTPKKPIVDRQDTLRDKSDSVLPPLDLKPSDLFGSEEALKLSALPPPIVTVEDRAPEPPHIQPSSDSTSRPASHESAEKTSDSEVETGWQAIDADDLKSQWKGVP